MGRGGGRGVAAVREPIRGRGTNFPFDATVQDLVLREFDLLLVVLAVLETRTSVNLNAIRIYV